MNQTRHPVFVSPTGTGKTWTAIAMIADRISLGRRVYVLTPQEEIFDQWIRDLSNAGLNPGYVNREGFRGRGRMVYVCMPISLCNNLHMISKSVWPHEIVTDECHHSAADTWKRIYEYFPDAVRIGLTATPRRTDGRGLDDLYTHIVSTIGPAEAIEAGYLARPLIMAPAEYLSRLSILGDDYDPQEQAEALGQTRIIGDVIEQYERTFCGRPVLVACSTYEHAALMTDQFRSAGWNWDHLHSGLNTWVRKGILKRVKAGELSGVCTVGIGIEGMDIPGLYGLIWLRRTLSLTIYLQFIGRVLRPLPGKDRGIIIDPVGNLFIHGWPEAHRNWTLKGRAEVPDSSLGDELALDLRMCPVCAVMNYGGNSVCHFCGAKLDGEERPEGSGRKYPSMVDGELVPVSSTGLENIDRRISVIKGELVENAEKKAQADSRLETLDTVPSKAAFLRNNLFKGNRRDMFRNTVQDWL